jgi:hypothetical protein
LVGLVSTPCVTNPASQIRALSAADEAFLEDLTALVSDTSGNRPIRTQVSSQTAHALIAHRWMKTITTLEASLQPDSA